MPGWLTWFVSRFLFLMGFHHQHYKHNRFFGLDPPSTVHTHICLWKHEITSTYVRTYIYRCNQQAYIVYKTYPVLTFIFMIIPQKSTWCFCFNTNTVLGFALFLRFLRQDILLDLQGCRSITDTGIKRRPLTPLTTSLVKLVDDGLSSTSHLFVGVKPDEKNLVGGFKHVFIFNLTLGKIPNLTFIFFQMGWFNHQPAI